MNSIAYGTSKPAIRSPREDPPQPEKEPTTLRPFFPESAATSAIVGSVYGIRPKSSWVAPPAPTASSNRSTDPPVSYLRSVRPDRLGQLKRLPQDALRRELHLLVVIETVPPG